MSERIASLLICLVLLSAGPVSAYWTEEALRLEVQPPLSHVYHTDIASDGEGGVVIVWAQDEGVFVQRVNALGEVLWSPESGGLQLASCAPSAVAPQIVAASSGGWLIAWKEDDNSIRAQRLTSDPYFSWGSTGVAVCDPKPSPAELQIAPWDDGGMVVIWTDERDAGYSRVFGELLDENGNPQWDDPNPTRDGISLSVVEADCRNLRATAGGDEGCIVVCEQYDADTWIVVPRHVDDDGSVGPPYVASMWDGDCSNTEVIEFPMNQMPGVFIATENENHGILVQLVLSHLGPCWYDEEMRGVRLCPDACVGMTQSKPAVIADSPSSIVIAYELASGGGGGPHIYAQRITPNLQGFTREWVEGGKFVQGGTPGTAPDAVRPRLARNASEGTMIVWREPDSESIVAQSLDVEADRLWEEDTKLHSQTFDFVKRPDVLDEMLGGGCVVWMGERPGLPYFVHVNRFRSGGLSNFEVAVSEWVTGWHAWKVRFQFNTAQNNPTAAKLYYHALFGCDPVPTVVFSDYVFESAPKQSYSIVIPPYPTNPPNDNAPRGLPPGTYVYDVIPGGLPVISGTFSLSTEDNGYDPDYHLPLYIDGNDAQIQMNTAHKYCSDADDDFSFTDNGQTLPEGSLLSCDDTTAVAPPWITLNGRYDCQSVSFRIDSVEVPPPPPGVDDPYRRKVLLTLDQAVPFYEWRYLAFSAKVIPDPDNDRGGRPNNPDGWPEGALLLQFHQDNEIGPILGLDVRGHPYPDEGSPYLDIHLWYLDPDESGFCGECRPPRTGWAKVEPEGARFEVPPETWFDVIIGARFDPSDTCGEVKVWYHLVDQAGDPYTPVADEPTFDSDTIKLGFPEQLGPGVILPPPWDGSYVEQYIRHFDIGIYRGSWTLSDNPDLEMRFDEIRWGHSFQDVVSPLPPDGITCVLPYTCDPERARVTVTWQTYAPSTSGKLYYRRAGAGTWTAKNGTVGSCLPLTCYSAAFNTPGNYTYQYKVSAVIGGQTYESGIFEAQCGEPGEPQGAPAREQQPSVPLLTAVPNPFNPTTTLTFNVPAPSNVELVVYSADGSRVRTVASGKYEKGSHKVTWDGMDTNGLRVSSGVYFVRMTTGEVVLTTKLVLLR